MHVIVKKEEIDSEKTEGKIAVVLDVLIATSVITVGLQYGAKQVIPVRDKEEAWLKAREYHTDEILIVGEYQGQAIEGFLMPNPTELKEQAAGKTMILSTTNGTVAISKAARAKELYIASLLNGEAVAEAINDHHKEETVLIICSGSDGTFSLEDFYGAGYMLYHIVQQNEWQLTDVALAALSYYEGKRKESTQVLSASRVGRALYREGYEREVKYAAQCGSYSLIAKFDGNAIRMEEKRYVTNKAEV
nr:2-phosphosulfolactate phosphatase [Bacillus sp. 165]